MSSAEDTLRQIEQDSLAEWRIRLAAAEQLLELVDEELAAAQETVNRITTP